MDNGQWNKNKKEKCKNEEEHRRNREIIDYQIYPRISKTKISKNPTQKTR